MKYNFSKELEEQVRKEVHKILSEIEVEYWPNDEGYSADYNIDPKSLKTAEDKLVKLALEMY